MSIPKATQKINRISLFLAAGLVCACVGALWGSYALIRQQKARKRPFIGTSTLYMPVVAASMAPNFALVGSKTGKKYYASTCAAAKRIKPEKLVIFRDREEAEAHKYTPAANCPDLEVEKSP